LALKRLERVNIPPWKGNPTEPSAKWVTSREHRRVEIDDRRPAPRMQTSRDERYVANPNDHYVPNLPVIVIRKNVRAAV